MPELPIVSGKIEIDTDTFLKLLKNSGKMPEFFYLTRCEDIFNVSEFFVSIDRCRRIRHICGVKVIR